MNKNTIQIIPSKPCYQSSDIVEFSISGDVVSEFNFIRIRLYKISIEEEYDISENVLFFDLVTAKDGNSIIRIKAEYLNLGLYRIAYAELNIVEKGNHDNILKFDIYEDAQIYSPGFLIDSSCEEPCTYESINNKINDIYLHRENTKSSGFGDNTKSKFFTAFVFCKDIYLTKRYDYDKYEVIPFESLGYKDMIDFINKFLNLNGIQSVTYPLKEEVVSHNSPGIVISFPKIFADGIEEAGNIIEQEVELLLKTFSLTRVNYGSIISSTILDGTSLNIRIYKPNYTGSLMPGDEFGENPFNNRAIVKTLKDDGFINLCVTLYAEALNEKNIELAYSRLWSVLETISNKKSYPIGQFRRIYLDGTRIQGVPAPNKDKDVTAKDKIRELLREFINKNSELKKMFYEKYEGITTPDDILSVWSRHRNCMLHNGGCFPDDPLICTIKKNDFNICNQAHKSALKNSKVRTLHNDVPFDLLRQTVRIILVEDSLKDKKSLKNINISNLFMNLRQVPTYKFISFPIVIQGA